MDEKNSTTETRCKPVFLKKVAAEIIDALLVILLNCLFLELYQCTERKKNVILLLGKKIGNCWAVNLTPARVNY